LTDPLLLATARLSTFVGGALLTSASSFFFERDDRLFLVTSGHVVSDGKSEHYPDRVEIELHDDPNNLASSTGFSIPLYRNSKSIWRQGGDSAGPVDVAVVEIERRALPEKALFRTFTTRHLLRAGETVEIGASLLIVGFPLGFHDTLHHMAVARQAALASAYGLRFQGKGYFLTDARTHRGSSGAPVVMRAEGAMAGDPLPWRLLGIHAARLDMGARETDLDEALGLNVAWYADMLMTLTERR
jgi:S1-C subfamily serine protease